MVCRRLLNLVPSLSCRALMLAAILLPVFAATQSRAQFSCQSPLAAPIAITYTASNASSPGDGLTGLCAQTTNAVWLTFTPTVTGLHTISLCGSPISTVATLYAACGTTPLACDSQTCGSNAVLLFSLTAGHAYYLRVASLVGTAPGSFSLLITPPAAPPANDASFISINIPANTILNANNIGATGTDQTTCGALDTSDVWFTFGPEFTGKHRVDICTTAFAPVVSIHPSEFSVSSLCSADIATPNNIGCGSSGVSLVFNGTQNQGVLIRVAGVRGTFGPFSIVVWGPADNDLCSSPRVLHQGVVATGTTNPVLGTEATVDCVGAGNSSGCDVWYLFSPNDAGTYRFDLCGSNFDTVLSIHSACPEQLGSSVIACNDDSCSTRSAVSAKLAKDGVYYVRVAGKATPGGSPSFGSYALAVNLAAPDNDACANATTLVLGAPVSGDTTGATPSAGISTCSGTDTKDLWYAYTPAVSGLYEITTCGSALDTTLGIYASCTGSPSNCNDNDPNFCGSGSTGSHILVFINSGIRALIRVAGVNQAEGRFVLSINRVPPTNDACSSAQSLVLDTPATGTLTSANVSGFPSCNIPSGPDAWWTFTPAVSRYYRFSTCGSTLRGTLSLYPACPSSAATEIACSSGSSDLCPGNGNTLTTYLQAGLTYRVRVMQDTSVFRGTPYTLSVTGVPTPNDECANAATLALNTPTFGTSFGATGTSLVGGCATGDTKDVWYAFTPTLTGTYQFNTCAGSSMDTVLSVHASCSIPPIAPLACNDNDATCGGGGTLSRVTTRLTAGHTYYIRVAGANGAEGTFTLTAAIAVPANDTCASAQVINEGTFDFDTLAATTDALFINTSCIGFNLVNNDVWFRYIPSGAGAVTATLCGSNFDTAMAVSSADAGCPTSAAPYAVLGCNDDSVCPGSLQMTQQSTVNFQAEFGKSYFIRVGSRLAQTGSGTLTVSRVGAGCLCDWNHDGHVSIPDIFAFLHSWFIHQGDFNGDGTSNVADIFAMLRCYFGLPGSCVR